MLVVLGNKMKLLNSVISSFLGLFLARSETRPAPLPTVSAKRNNPRIKATFGADDKDFILNQLDDYFKIIRKIERRDSDAAALFSKIGVRLLHSNSLIRGATLPKDVLRHMPSFAASAFSGHDDSCDFYNTLPVKFWYLRKMQSVRPGFECVKDPSETAFEITAHLFKSPRKVGFSGTFCVAVSESGQVRALREKKTSFIYLPRSKARKTATGQRNKAQARCFMDNEFLKANANEKGRSIDETAALFFNMIASSCIEQSGGITMRASRHGRIALFTLSHGEAKKLFKDRSKVKTESGRTRPIFHYNRGSIRQSAHYKGLRDFHWNGYEIHIRVDKHFAKELANVGAMVDADDVSENKIGKEYMTSKNVGRRIAKYVSSISTRDMNRAIR